MNTTYIDVTQLVHWSGPLTGIPKVMYELAVRFAKLPDVRFVSWVKDRGELCEVDFLSTMAQRGQGIVYLHPGENNVPAATIAPARPSLSRRAKRVAKAAARRLLKFNTSFAGRVEARYRKSLVSNLKPASFTPGDVLFIGWGEWWDQQFTTYVVAQENAGTKVVQVIHDIATTTQPQFYEQVAVSPTTYNAAVLPNADLVLAVSANTKRELEEWLRASKRTVPRIEVIRNGDDIAVARSSKPTDPAFIAAGLKGNDFLLTVGTIEAKKNHALFYYVYQLARARKITLPKLVIVGRRGWGTDDIYRIMTTDPHLKDQFVFLHSASDEELAWLYDHCLFTVQTSFHEGWGIPIAQSASRGVPCLCSNTSSMIEIAEGIVEHFSPASTDECLAGIQRWLNPETLAKARQRTKRYKPTRWDDTFAQTIKHMKEL